MFLDLRDVACPYAAAGPTFSIGPSHCYMDCWLPVVQFIATEARAIYLTPDINLTLSARVNYLLVLVTLHLSAEIRKFHQHVMRMCRI